MNTKSIESGIHDRTFWPQDQLTDTAIGAGITVPCTDNELCICEHKNAAMQGSSVRPIDYLICEQLGYGLVQCKA